MDNALKTQFQYLRARVESDLKTPAVVVVTSASAGDGKSITAIGLAEALRQVGHRVALVDASAVDESSRPALGPAPGANSGLYVSGLRFDRDNPFESREHVRSLVRDTRGEFDFTIIDAAPFIRNSVAMLLASTVDGVLIAVRLGRSPTDEDVLMMRALDQARANVLGVVAVAPEHIDKHRSLAAGFPLERVMSRESVPEGLFGPARLPDGALSALSQQS
jgi:Mrp family chromosome partitioning ATPase